jgi:tetratricopeptide (TPR) repeat protein
MNQKAILIAEAAVSSDNADLQSKQNLARSYSRSGFVLVLLGKTEEALTSLRKSEKLSRELVDNAPRNAVYQKDFGRLYVRFGDFYRKQKDLPAALESYQNSAERFRMVHENDRNDTVAKRDMAQSLKNVAETFVLMNRKGDAAGTFRNALDILLELEAANAIGNYDKKMITDVRSALEKLTSG